MPLMSREEIQELLAEFENRISYLELLHTPSNAEIYGTLPEEVKEIDYKSPSLPPIYQWRQQLEARLIYNENKLNKHLDKKKEESPY